MPSLVCKVIPDGSIAVTVPETVLLFPVEEEPPDDVFPPEGVLPPGDVVPPGDVAPPGDVVPPGDVAPLELFPAVGPAGPVVDPGVVPVLVVVEGFVLWLVVVVLSAGLVSVR